MTSTEIRVDFYILADATTESRLRFACRLTEKAYLLKNRTYAHVPTAAQARQLDELLWTFRDGSFIPHAIANHDDMLETPVLIGAAADYSHAGEFLINLTDTIPNFFDHFARVAEIVDASDAGRQAGRERYSIYRDNGYSPNTHNIA
jgi:DNA polymerase-3 subunit chi